MTILQIHKHDSSAALSFHPSSSSIVLIHPSNSASSFLTPHLQHGLQCLNFQKICGPGASASSSEASGFLASTSPTTDESSEGCGPSFQLCLLDNCKTGDDTDLPAGSISMSNLVPLSWSLLRLRSSLSFSEKNDSMGRREGRQARAPAMTF